MPMVPFLSLVGERAFKDMRTVIVMKGRRSLLAVSCRLRAPIEGLP